MAKHKKLDPNFVSKQKWEIAYVAKKFDCNTETVLRALNFSGKSRRKLYSELRELGYNSK